MVERKNDISKRQTVSTYQCPLVDKPGKRYERSRRANGPQIC